MRRGSALALDLLSLWRSRRVGMRKWRPPPTRRVAAAPRLRPMPSRSTSQARTPCRRHRQVSTRRPRRLRYCRPMVCRPCPISKLTRKPMPLGSMRCRSQTGSLHCWRGRMSTISHAGLRRQVRRLLSGPNGSRLRHPRRHRNALNGLVASSAVAPAAKSGNET